VAYTHTWGLTFKSGGQSVSTTTETVTSSGEANIDEAIPMNADDYKINLAIDISVLKSIFILASKDMDLYTNHDHDDSPDHHIVLKADQALRWTVNSSNASPFALDASDVVDIRVVGGAVAGTLQIWTLQDATP
jgi:hypothetical protein